MAWTRDEHREWSFWLAVIGASMAFIWLGTDYWFFGLFAIVCLVFSFWADLEANRV
jgi:hypothetical protein